MFTILIATLSLLGLAVVVGLVWTSSRASRGGGPMASDPASEVDSGGFDAGGSDT